MSGVWGLGPTFNDDRCSKCHEHNGRARTPENEHETPVGMLVRLSTPGKTSEGAPLPHPEYGDQFNDKAIAGASAEGRLQIAYVAQV